MADAPVQIKGLREFRNAVRKVDASMPKDMGRALKEISTDIVEKARERAQGLPGKASESFAGGLKAKSDQTAAKVTLDATRYPTLLGDEFGSKRYRQFQPWLGNQYQSPFESGPGYALHPTIRDESDNIDHKVTGLLDEWIARLATES